jgi:hypothetical protein
MLRAFFAFLLSVFGFGATSIPDAGAGPRTEEKSMGPRERVLSVAQSLVGTTEATGRNDGPVIERILESTGNRKGDPYCAAFNYYCYEEAGLGQLVPRSAWSPSWVAKPTWTRAEGGRTPEPADAFGIYFKAKKRVAHTGLVKKWGQAVVTLEGNTSPDAAAGSAADRDGGGIWSKRRLQSQIHSVRNWIDGK